MTFEADKRKALLYNQGVADGQGGPGPHILADPH